MKKVCLLLAVICLGLLTGAAYAQAPSPTFDPFASGSFYHDATPAPVASPVQPTPSPTVTPTEVVWTPTALPQPPASKDGVEMVYVNEGAFLMGSDAETAFRSAQPAHEVLLKGFWIDKYAVSNERFGQCVEQGYCVAPRDLSSATRPDYFTNEVYANYPVIHVDWNQAYAYCNWAGKRLPTEAEWEKAARGSEGLLYPWGNELPDSLPMAVNGFERGDTVPVDAFPEGVSPYGVYNLAGNVWEWTADQYDEYYYSKSPLENPRSVTGGNNYVIRGFSWAYPFNIYEISVRNASYILNHTYDLGFRCAADL